MNLNELVLNRGRGRGKKNIRGKINNVFGINKMGPPQTTTVKKKASSTSSDLNWGRSHISVLNTPSTIQKSATSSKISSEEESRVIVALTEGRGDARCEVGIAAIRVSTPLLILCQISDTQSYINTLTKINIFNPQEILIPVTFIETYSGNRLIDKVKEKFPNVKYTGVPRSTFNKVNGMDILSDICIPSLNSMLLVLQHRYYALAAASALITYIQESLYIYYSGGSIKIDYQESEGNSIIDVSTADRLELVCSAKPAQGNKYSSLFGILNHCVTKIGARTLRSSILQPPCDEQYIEERLNCVTELIKHPEMLLSIQALLQKVSNIDLLLSIGTIVPDDPQKCSNRQLNYILLLNSLTDLIAPLKEILSKSNQPFFVKLKSTLESEEFITIKDIVRRTIQENAYPAKGQAAIVQRCFAIKPGINGLLDLVRKAYSERIDDMRVYIKRLAEKYDLALTPGNNQTKGHHIVLSLNQTQKRHMKKSDLPEEFIQVYRLAGSFTMKTPELVNISTRLDDIMADILRISNVMVHSIIIEIKKYISLFYKICEEVANLDVLQSLAETSIRNGYVRPEFGDFTEVTFSRHPLLDFLLPSKPISNPISCSRDENVHIITGPNGSGKSIFIRQVLLLQVMAQVGCYVPAQTAIFRPADRMYARIYLEDNMEYGASSFILEMKEIKYIMTTMTENSLIIIDELCRSTSLEEGTALAIAVLEKMAQSSAFIYITTHFTLLTKIYDMYLNVKLWQLETVPSGEDPKTFKLNFKYNLVSGVTSVKRYGVYIVRNIWPDSVLQYVDELLDNMTKKPTDPKIVAIDEKVRLKYNVEAQFRKLKSQNKLTVCEVNKLLTWYQTELQKLGYSINVHPLSSADSFTEHIDANMPQIRHSILDNIQSFPEYNQNYEEEDLHSRDERMKHIFTPDASMSSQISIPDPEARKTEERLNDIFTPEQSQISDNYSLQNDSDAAPCNYQNDVDFRESDDFSDTSSYRNISNFIGANSENIYKLMPKVNISYDETTQTNSNNSQNAFAPCWSDAEPANNINPLPEFIAPRELSNQMNKYPAENQDVGRPDWTPSIDLSKDMNDFRFSLPLHNNVAKTSTPVKRREYLSQSSSPVVHIYSQRQNFSTPSSNNIDLNHNIAQPEIHHLNHLDEIDLESICDDLEVCSRIFTEIDDDFEERSLDTTYRSLPDDKNSPKEPLQTNLRHQNIMPTVTIIEGPNNTTLSIDEEDLREEATKTTIGTVQEPKNKINIISDIALTASGNIKAKNGFNEGGNLERITVEVNKESDMKQLHKREHELHTSVKENLTNTFQIVKQFNNKEKLFQSKTDSTDSIESDDGQMKSIFETLEKQFTTHRNIPEIASDSRDSFKSARSDSYESNNVLTGNNEESGWKQADCNKNINESYKSIEEDGDFKREGTKSDCNCSKSKEADESNKSLEKDGKENCNSDNNIEPYEDLSKNDIDSQTMINNTSEDPNLNSSDHEIVSIEDYHKPAVSVDESNAQEPCLQHEVLEEIANSICVEEKQKSEDKLKSNVTTSISNASKLRNLDQATSDSSVLEENSTKKTPSTNNNDKTITSISSASKKRNLDNVTTTSSPSDQSNNKSAVRIILVDKSETTSSQKESDVSEPKKKKVARKQFSMPRSAEVKENSQTSVTASEKSKKNKRLNNKRKFVPPRKLSAKEIREEFREQDRKILESSPTSSNFSKYLEQLIKRPSVKQIQNTTHLALIRKTHEGVEVIPAEPARKKRKRSPFKRRFSSENFNMTIFSDKNAVPFENYLNSNVTDYKTFNFNFGAAQENVQKEEFKFVPTTESLSEYTNNSVTKHFVRTTSELQVKEMCGQESTKPTLVKRNTERCENSQICFSQTSFNEILTPDGFYKENKDDITRILNKYLQSRSQSSQQERQRYFNRGDVNKRSIFENTDLSTSDLNI